MRWDATEFLDTVGRLLDQRGWTQAELARQTNDRISQTAINAWFLHQRKPRPETLAVLAEVTGLDYDELMRMCGYSTRREPARIRFPEVASLLSLIESGLNSMSDPAVRRAQAAGIEGYARSVLNAHPPRRRNRRQQSQSDEPEETYALGTYALLGASIAVS